MASITVAELIAAAHIEMREAVEWVRELRSIPAETDARYSLISGLVRMRDSVTRVEQYLYAIPDADYAAMRLSSDEDGSLVITPSPGVGEWRIFASLLDVLHAFYRYRTGAENGPDDVRWFIGRAAGCDTSYRYAIDEHFVHALVAIGQAPTQSH